MYTFLGLHFKRWFWFIWPLAFFLRIKIFPKSITKENFQERVENKAVVYILPRFSVLDIFVLNCALKKLKQPPIKTESNLKTIWKSSILALRSRSLFFQMDDKEFFVKKILQLIKADANDKRRQFLFFPVSVYWSRAAERNEKGFVLRSLFPDDGTGNFLQKLLMLILHRGEVSVSFGKEIEIYLPKSNQNPVPTVQKFINKNLDLLYAHRLRRQIFIEFAKERTAFLGPVLYEQEKITQWILSSPQTKNFLMDSEHPEKTKHQISKYIREIAANYHYATLRAVEQIFDFIWTKVFTGIRVRNYEKIERLIKDNCVIWMPCHRSHFDYLLLNYLLFKQGAIAPHVAAGINLNFWPMGPFLRSGGAFFIRRSFSGNKTYTHTFSEYVNFLLHNSYPIEFFPEGGRSRIGKLLSPKLGMLSICLQSIMSRKSENTYLMPVSINYDKVMEDNTYAKELKGSKKQKENVLQFLNGVRKVFANYGSVDVSFGEPIRITDAWKKYLEKFGTIEQESFPSEFADLPDNIDTRDPKIQAFVKYLAYRVHQRINSAATASSTSLLCTALLTNKNKQIDARSLILQMLILHYTVNELKNKLQWQISTSKTPDHVFEYINAIFDHTKSETEKIVSAELFHPVAQLAEEYIQMGKTWHLLSEKTEQENVIYIKNPEKEFNLWWYRGTTFHIFAIMGVLAKTLISCERCQISNLEFIFETLRKLWETELFWDEETSNRQFIKSGLEILSSLKVLTFDSSSDEVFSSNDKSPETEDSSSKVSSQFTRNNILQFYADTISPEIDLYGLFLATGLFFVHKKRFFTRGEILDRAYMVHELAYKHSVSAHPSAFIKIFGNSIFDALSRQNIFINTERERFSVDMVLIGGISEFFDIKKWKNFII